MKYGKIKEILNNKSNRRFYQVFDSYECGMVLTSQIVKKILNFRISLSGSYGWIKKEEIWLKGLVETDIKLLLKKEEIRKIIQKKREKNYLLIPNNLYIKNRKIKIDLMLVKREKYTNKEKLRKKIEKSEKMINYY